MQEQGCVRAPDDSVVADTSISGRQQENGREEIVPVSKDRNDAR
jgi:hypothetical protein